MRHGLPIRPSEPLQTAPRILRVRTPSRLRTPTDRPNPHSFAALETHLKLLQAESAAHAAAEMSKMEIKESKTGAATKGAAGKKRKAAGSTGVEKLKKANTKGMAKLSTFFQPKSAS